MTAAEAAAAEARRWQALAGRAAAWNVSEYGIVLFHDPRPDLEKRAARWQYHLDAGDLADLCRFAAALARAEAEAWAADEPHVATRAYEERRFLAGDRIIPWAVPWLDAVGEGDARDGLLALGDELRPAPASGEGLTVPGEDAYGPIEVDVPLAELVRSLWSGMVAGDEPTESGFRAAAAKWAELAARHAGTAALWRALSARAAATAVRLAGGPGAGLISSEM